jgi:cellulose synthase/poly-beta-1,6-N-acetylglucosamine synthase-like glycosyltransferase
MIGTVFAVATTLVWLSVFGYLSVLLALARRRRAQRVRPSDLPRIAIVIAMRNEEELIGAKIDDLLRTDYPANQVEFLFVDGGSSDRTLEIVRAASERLTPFEILEVPSALCKGDQIDAALRHTRAEIVVATDVDARLEPRCVRVLVEALMADPTTNAFGAVVDPATPLLEERIHWALQNLFWWAEGEALGAAMASGVALAFRRSVVPRIPPHVAADDAYIMMRAAMYGGARLSLNARATEVRVPERLSEFVEFRNRRGAGYEDALRCFPPVAGAPLGARAACAVRRWHFRIFPKLVFVSLISGLLVLFTQAWTWVGFAALSFALPLMLIARGALRSPTRLGAWDLFVSSIRTAAINCSVLFRGAGRPMVRAEKRPL